MTEMALEKVVGGVLSITEAFSKTTGEFSFFWDVENFQDLQPSPLLSPVFSSCGKWQLILEPKVTIEGDVYTTVDLQLVQSPSSDNVRVHFRISLIDTAYKILKTDGGTGDFTHENFCGVFWKKSELIFASGPNSSDGDTLKLHCHAKISTQNASLPIMHWPEVSKPKSNDLVDPMEDILANGYFSDVILKTSTKEHKASKIILAASPVFLKMFTVDMKEKGCQVVPLDDDDDDVAIEGMLKYLYTGRISLPLENVSQLLKTADKYDLEDLKEKCADVLLYNLTVKRAAETLCSATFFNVPDLKLRTLLFINRFKDAVMETESFDELRNEHPEVFAAIL